MTDRAPDPADEGPHGPAAAFQAEDGEHRPPGSPPVGTSAERGAAGAFQAEEGEHLGHAR